MRIASTLLLRGLLWCFFCLGVHSFSEDLYATQLIGSHFGIPDIPLTYDYVIVGGGTAGLVMARRLAANSTVTVAVIEAGGFYELDNGNFSEIPGYASQFTRKSWMVLWRLTAKGSSPSLDAWSGYLGSDIFNL